MPNFQGRTDGVIVRDDNGRVLGKARHYGQPLSAADALQQLGYIEDPDAPDGSGVTVLAQVSTQAAKVIAARDGTVEASPAADAIDAPDAAPAAPRAAASRSRARGAK